MSLQNKLVQVREVDHGRSQDPDRGRIPRHPWTTSSRPPGARPVIEEILPDRSETISGCEIGEEENPGRGCGSRPARRIATRNLLQLSASAFNAPTEARLRHEDFFPAPFRLPPEQPEPPEKGALPL